MIDKINNDNWNFTPPNGESQKTVEERMINWVEETLLNNYRDDSVVGVFTHGMAIKCFLRGVIGFSPKITYKIPLDNTSITRLTYSKRWDILAIGDSSHLNNDDIVQNIKYGLNRMN